MQLASALSGEGAALIPIGGAQVGGAENRFKPEDGWRLIMLFERYEPNSTDYDFWI